MNPQENPFNGRPYKILSLQNTSTICTYITTYLYSRIFLPSCVQAPTYLLLTYFLKTFNFFCILLYSYFWLLHYYYIFSGFIVIPFSCCVCTLLLEHFVVITTCFWKTLSSFSYHHRRHSNNNYFQNGKKAYYVQLPDKISPIKIKDYGMYCIHFSCKRRCVVIFA